MEKTIKTGNRIFGERKTAYILFSLAAASAACCAVWSCLHYADRLYGNQVTWISWILSMGLLVLAFYKYRAPKQKRKLRLKTGMALIGLLSALFIVSHLWNFDTAPWNHNGLFDDAAWNVYYALRYIFSGQPFQAAFYDHGIAREVIFHYYITFLFKIFGYNLLTFNLSVMALGFVTYLFTILLIQKIFKNHAVTVISAVIMNFFPLHFLFCFVGQRYAMVPPLMASSLYFLYKGFKDRSYFSISLSSVLAGLCFSSGIMGKQYLMGLFGAFVLSLLFNFRKSFTDANWKFLKLFVAGVIISAMPMLIYIIYNKDIYFANESNYTNLFFNTIRSEGYAGFLKYYERMANCLFGNTYYKWFIPDFPLIPVHFYLFLIPGFAISFIRKQYQFITVALVPVAGAFISGFSDYRVFMAAPLWVILMAYTINEMVKTGKDFRFDAKDPMAAVKKLNYRLIGMAAAVVIFIVGIIPCIRYIDGKSRDPYSVYFFAQKDVAVSRFLRDIAAGIPDPSPAFRQGEFRKLKGMGEPDYDTFICQNLGYAITHTFLFDYDDKKILSFSDQLPYNLLQEQEILNINKRVIENYRKNAKDLKLVWEETEKTRRIIGEFKKLNYLGSDETLSSQHEGRSFTIYVLNIKNENIEEFKQKAREIKL